MAVVLCKARRFYFHHCSRYHSVCTNVHTCICPVIVIIHLDYTVRITNILYAALTIFTAVRKIMGNKI